jgi:1-acyl-sn-glycerol-3-phosphate acyltransferase
LIAALVNVDRTTMATLTEHEATTERGANPAVVGPAAINPLKLAWGTVATILGVIYTIILAPFSALSAPLFNGHAVTHIGALWSWLIIKTCGVRVEIEGVENVRNASPCIIVSNHQSFFDIFAALAYLPCEPRFIAKRELMKIPLVGYAMRRAHHLIIDRQAGGQAIRRVLEVTQMGYSIVVFAEGHRFSDGRVHEFSEGAAWMAITTKLPIVPMTVSGSALFFPPGAKLVVPGGKMRIVLGKPIETKGLTSRDRRALSRQLEEAVRANLAP